MEMDALALVTAGLRGAVGTDCGLCAVVKFVFPGVGVVVIDATTVPNRVDNEDRPAACTLTQSLEDFVAMHEGRLSATRAMMTGRLRIAGSMALALRLDTALAPRS